MSLPNQRIVYLNGKFVPEDEATIPIKDQGAKYGDGFDTTRTFEYKIFRLKEHLERFRHSKVHDLDPGHSMEDFQTITEEVVNRNLPLLDEKEDYWVTQRVTGGYQMTTNSLARLCAA